MIPPMGHQLPCPALIELNLTIMEGQKTDNTLICCGKYFNSPILVIAFAESLVYTANTNTIKSIIIAGLCISLTPVAKSDLS